MKSLRSSSLSVTFFQFFMRVIFCCCSSKVHREESYRVRERERNYDVDDYDYFIGIAYSSNILYHCTHHILQWVYVHNMTYLIKGSMKQQSWSPSLSPCLSHSVKLPSEWEKRTLCYLIFLSRVCLTFPRVFSANLNFLIYLIFHNTL